MDPSVSESQGNDPAPKGRSAGTKFYAGGAIIAVAIIGLVVWAMNRPGSTAFYLTTTEVAAGTRSSGAEEVRVNGNVVPGTVSRDGLATTFAITDGNTQVTVHTERPLPDSFRDDAQTEIVARGSYDGQRFNASEVLAKCPSKFRAKA
jgi:cytochrome c-type biogenesis protein CcmE